MKSFVFVLASTGVLAFVSGPTGETRVVDVADVASILIDGDERTRTDPVATSHQGVVPDVVRHVIDDVSERTRSIQDHDDIEESDIADVDVPRDDDGRVVNGEFEGQSVARGHNVVTSESEAPDVDD